MIAQPAKTLRLLWALWTIFVAYGATIPFQFAGDGTSVFDKLRDGLQSSGSNRDLSIPDVTQNILLFVPFGALGFLAGAAKFPFRRTLWMTSLGLLLSLVVEAAQLFTIDRVASLTDVAANTSGALMGALTAWLLRDAFHLAKNRLRREGLAGVPELRPLGVSALLLLVAFWQPFDFTLDVGVVAAKVRALQGDSWQFSGFRDEGTSIMLSVFLATSLSGYLSVLGERRPALQAAILGCVFLILLESSQLVVESRMPGLWDFSIALLGLISGCSIWVAATRIEAPRLWLAVIVLATLGSAALQMLSPFKWTATYHTMGWFPFFSYYSHTTVETLSHVLESALLYVPVGFFIGKLEHVPWRAAITALGLSLLVAGSIECLQGWIVDRYPDVTDVAMGLCGGWIGASAASMRPDEIASRISSPPEGP